MLARGAFPIREAFVVLESRLNGLNLAGIEEGFPLPLNPKAQPPIQDVARHRRFEDGITDEDDHGLECVIGEVEEFHQGADVEPVLVQRVLEPLLSSVDLLGPLALFFTAEDPSTVVLRFHDKDAVGRNDNVIELGSPVAVRARKIKIVKDMVGRRIKSRQSFPDPSLTDPPLEPRGGEEPNKDADEKERRQCGPLGQQRLKHF